MFALLAFVGLKGKMFLYKNLNTGDFVIFADNNLVHNYKNKRNLDLNSLMFIREIKEVRISGERGCFLVSENTHGPNDIVSVV